MDVLTSLHLRTWEKTLANEIMTLKPKLTTELTTGTPITWFTSINNKWSLPPLIPIRVILYIILVSRSSSGKSHQSTSFSNFTQNHQQKQSISIEHYAYVIQIITKSLQGHLTFCGKQVKMVLFFRSLMIARATCEMMRKE
jgi:hypothetical protein